MNEDMTKKCDIAGFIERLGQCEAPRARFGCPIRKGIIHFLCIALYMCVCALLFNLRYNYTDLMASPLYVGEIIFALFMGLSALIAAAHLQAPDTFGREWLVAFTFTLFLCIIAVFVWHGFSHANVWHVHSKIIMANYGKLLLFSLPPIMLLSYFARKWASVAPVKLALLQTLGVGALGWIGQRLTCCMDDLQHAVIAPWLMVLVIGLLFALIAPRLYRW